MEETLTCSVPYAGPWAPLGEATDEAVACALPCAGPWAPLGAAARTDSDDGTKCIGGFVGLMLILEAGGGENAPLTAVMKTGS